MIFQDGKYRTDGLNPALAIILQKFNGLQKEKTGNIVISENVSGELSMTGQLSNHFIEGMRKIYELVLLYDEDKAGHSFRDSLCKALVNEVKSLKVIKLPGLDYRESPTKLNFKALVIH